MIGAMARSWDDAREQSIPSTAQLLTRRRLKQLLTLACLTLVFATIYSTVSYVRKTYDFKSADLWTGRFGTGDRNESAGLQASPVVLDGSEADSHEEVGSSSTEAFGYRPNGDNTPGYNGDTPNLDNQLVDADVNGETEDTLSLSDHLVNDDSSNSDPDKEESEEVSDFAGEDEEALDINTDDHREVFSVSTRDRKFSYIYFDDKTFAYNPNVIPHPTRHDAWIVVAQRVTKPGAEVTCVATYIDDVLVCTEPPTVVPIPFAAVKGVDCDEEHASMGGGPRDARMLYGPDTPYIMYGSQSQYTCLGLWIQDARALLDPFYIEQSTGNKFYKEPTEVRRPDPWGMIQKNFFLFWDSEGKTYAHHDVSPNRVFAQLDIDGSVGPDLAPLSASHDQSCMAKYMPTIGPELESLHQATNSLSITFCKRAYLRCIPDDTNTFIMHIFQHKTYFNYHAVYEPYVMLFQRTAPFAVHAISQVPLWIHGRNALTIYSASLRYQGRNESEIPKGHTEMFYITSMSWKTHGQRYHGHIDDTLTLAFGVEDSRSAVIDVTAGDLLQDLAYC